MMGAFLIVEGDLKLRTEFHSEHKKKQKLNAGFNYYLLIDKSQVWKQIVTKFAKFVVRHRVNMTNI